MQSEPAFSTELNKKSSPILKSRQWISIMKMMCAGNLAASDAAIEDSTFESHVEKIELKSMLNFQRGITIKPRTPSKSFAILWKWCLGGGFLQHLAFLFCKFSIDFSRIGLSNNRFFKLLYNRWMPNLIHYRYIDFQSGLVMTAILRSLCPSAYPVEKAYLLGLQGHFYGMSGCFKRSLALLNESLRRLAVLKDHEQDAETQFYIKQYEIEICCIYSLHLSYDGRFEQSNEAYDQALMLIKETPYWWFEVFLRSMRQYHCIETIDEQTMQKDTQALKQLMGLKAFNSKFGLRIVAMSALLAATNKQMRTARILALNAKGFYKASSTNVEIGRYHFILSLIYLELRDFESSRMHALIAEHSFSEIPGGRFHQADAILLAVEIHVRALISLPQYISSIEHLKTLQKKIKSALRLVSSCASIQARAEFLRRVIDDLLLSNPPRSSYKLMLDQSFLAPRIKRAAQDFELLATSQSKETPSSRVYFDAQQVSLDILDESLRTINGTDSVNSTANFLKTILGAEQVDIITNPKQSSSESNSPSISHLDDAIDVMVPLRRDVITFHVCNPLVNLSFEVLSEGMVTFGARLLQLLEAQKEAEKDAAKIAISEISCMIAHDLRTPLAVFEGLLNIPDDNPIGFEKPLIRQALYRLNSMADALRRTEVESIVRIIPVELNFEFGIRALREKADPKHVKLEYPSKDMPVVMVDVPKFERAWMNLLSNAIDATHSTVKVEVETRGRELILRICDDGDGVPEPILGSIFERGVTFGKDGGTGLGLSYVKHIMEAHGGHVSYRRDMGWSVFECILPNAVEHPRVKQLASVENIGHSISKPAEKHGRIVIAFSSVELNQKVIDNLKSMVSGTAELSLVVDDSTQTIVTDSSEYFDISLEKDIKLIIFDAGTCEQEILRRTPIRLGL